MEKLWEALTHRKLLHTEGLYTQQALTQRRFYTQQVFTEISLYRQRLLHREAFAERSFCTQQTFTRRKLLHTDRIWKPLHTASFCTEKLFRKKLLHTEAFTAFTQRSFYIHKHFGTMVPEIAAPKPDLSAKAKKRRFWSTFLKGISKGKSPAPKLRKSADKSLTQPWSSHSNTIYDVQLQKTIVLHTQPRHQATITVRSAEPSCKRQKNYAQQREKLQLQNRISAPTKLSCETSLKKWKWKMWKRSFRARLPSKKWKWKMWKRSFRARLPSKSESWRCENEAFVRDILQILKVQVAQNDAWTVSSTAGPIRPWSEHSRDRSGPFRNRRATDLPHPSSKARFVLQNTTFRASANFQKRISCETSLKICQWQMWQRSFRARLLDNGGCDNGVRWWWYCDSSDTVLMLIVIAVVVIVVMLW